MIDSRFRAHYCLCNLSIIIIEDGFFDDNIEKCPDPYLVCQHGTHIIVCFYINKLGHKDSILGLMSEKYHYFIKKIINLIYKLTLLDVIFDPYYKFIHVIFLYLNGEI